jgi:hypothetical protein
MRVCLLLVLPLLVASSTACAALCLRMQHSGTPVMAPVHAAAVHTAAAPEAAGMLHQPSDTGADDDATNRPDRPETQRACCLDRHSTNTASLPSGRHLPEDAAASPPTEPGPSSEGRAAPGWFDPALQKPAHLTPSLTALSISRT